MNAVVGRPHQKDGRVVARDVKLGFWYEGMSKVKAVEVFGDVDNVGVRQRRALMCIERCLKSEDPGRFPT